MPAEKEASIGKGLAYLYSTQQPGGYWHFSAKHHTETGAAAFAFLSRREKWGAHSNAYQMAADRAVAHLLAAATRIKIDAQTEGAPMCPAGSTTCISIQWPGDVQATFATAMIAPAIALYGLHAGADQVAVSSGPLAGLTWQEIAQGVTNYLAEEQVASLERSLRGGDIDRFSTYAAVLAFRYNEALGVVAPAEVKNKLRDWLEACTACGGADADEWLSSLQFAGYEVGDARVQTALSRLRATQADGNAGHPVAAFTVYQGLESTIGFDTPTSGAAWWEHYCEQLVRNQKSDGHWDGHLNWSAATVTAFSVNILGRSRVPSQPEKTSMTGKAKTMNEPAPGVVRAIGGVVETTDLPPPTATPTVRLRVRRGIAALALNGDGTILAGAGTDNSIRTWEPDTGQSISLARGSMGVPSALVFSTDERTLESAGRDSVVRIWDSRSGQQVAQLAAHEHPIRALVASADGLLLASAGEETRIMLWDQTSRRLKRILHGPADFVNALSFSPDNRILASAGEDGRVILFDVDSGNPTHTLLGHSGHIDSVVFSPDGATLASGGQDSVVRLWDSARGQQRRALTGHSAPIRCIAFSPDGQLAASSGDDTRIILWNTATGAIDKILIGSTGAVNALVFDPKGRFLASASESGEITLWNVIAGVRLRTIKD